MSRHENAAMAFAVDACNLSLSQLNKAMDTSRVNYTNGRAGETRGTVDENEPFDILIFNFPFADEKKRRSAASDAQNNSSSFGATKETGAFDSFYLGRGRHMELVDGVFANARKVFLSPASFLLPIQPFNGHQYVNTHTQTPARLPARSPGPPCNVLRKPTTRIPCVLYSFFNSS